MSIRSNGLSPAAAFTGHRRSRSTIAVARAVESHFGARQCARLGGFHRPADGAILDARSPVQLTVEATDPDGTVVAVYYFANGDFLGEGFGPDVHAFGGHLMQPGVYLNPGRGSGW